MDGKDKKTKQQQEGIATKMKNTRKKKKEEDNETILDIVMKKIAFSRLHTLS